MVLEDFVPAARTGHTAISMGEQMIVWGGQGAGGLLADGALYNPGSDIWTPIATDGAPAPRRDHSAVWTGSRMTVWGGDVGGGTGTSTGGLYDPFANAGLGGWTATSVIGAPGARFDHTAIWTGTQMLVWGGSNDSSGGRYDPSTDTWRPTALANAPSLRNGHSAVWTGSKMIVWGGSHFNGQITNVYGTGGVYDPALDTWTPTSMIDAPEPRFDHAAAWTGQEMLVWGGSALSQVDRVMHWYGNAHQGPLADSDGDGVLSCQDCDDHNAAVWGLPGEVTGLLFSDAITIDWSPPAFAGATIVGYDLLRSDVASDFQTSAECVASGIKGTAATDTSAPPTGGVFFYLVRALNACPGGMGTLGTDSAGAPRLAAACP
jgi:hypothetical protein